MSVKFCPIASGSGGNCIYVATDNTSVLIDAGLSGKRIEQGLKSINVECKNIDAILITHEHSDHVKGAGILSRRFNIPIYASLGTWKAMDSIASLGTISPKNKMLAYSEENLIINDLCVRPFEISHDAAEPFGYNIFAEDKKMTVATDMGFISDIAKENIYGSDILLLESNHDIDMLMNGKYPLQLKRRILSNHGHLSNVTAGQFIVQIMCEKTKHIFLGHLSEENNRPILAFETVKNILLSNNIDVGNTLNLYLADRYKASKLIVL